MTRTAGQPSWLDNPLMPLYAYLAAIGVMAAREGYAPRALEVTTPLWLTIAWSVAVALAGVLTLYGCIRGRNRVEAAGLALLVFGLGLLTLAETTRGLEADDTLAIVTLTGCAWLRLRVLRKARKAVKRARREVLAGEPDA